MRFTPPLLFLSPLDTEHVSLVLPWIAQRMFNTIQYNIYLKRLDKRTIPISLFLKVVQYGFDLD